MPITARDTEVLNTVQDTLNDWGVPTERERRDEDIAPEQHAALMPILAPSFARFNDNDFLTELRNMLPAGAAVHVIQAAGDYLLAVRTFLDNIEAGLRQLENNEQNAPVLADYICNFFQSSPPWYTNVAGLMQNIYALTRETDVYDILAARLSSLVATVTEAGAMLDELDSLNDDEQTLPTHLSRLATYATDNPVLLASPEFVDRVDTVLIHADCTDQDIEDWLRNVEMQLAHRQLPPPIISVEPVTGEPGFNYNGVTYPNYLQARRAQENFRADTQRVYFPVPDRRVGRPQGMNELMGLIVGRVADTLNRDMERHFLYGDRQPGAPEPDGIIRGHRHEQPETVQVNINTQGFRQPRLGEVNMSVHGGGGGGSGYASGGVVRPARLEANNGELRINDAGVLQVYITQPDMWGRTGWMNVTLPERNDSKRIELWLYMLSQLGPHLGDEIILTDAAGVKRTFSWASFMYQQIENADITNAGKDAAKKPITAMAKGFFDNKKLIAFWAQRSGRFVLGRIRAGLVNVPPVLKAGGEYVFRVQDMRDTEQCRGMQAKFNPDLAIDLRIQFIDMQGYPTLAQAKDVEFVRALSDKELDTYRRAHNPRRKVQIDE